MTIDDLKAEALRIESYCPTAEQVDPQDFWDLVALVAALIDKFAEAEYV